MAEILINPKLQKGLRAAMIFEEDLVEAVREQVRNEVTPDTGAFTCVCQIPVPRPLDPETAELKQLELLFRPIGPNRWEIYQVRGLEGLETV